MNNVLWNFTTVERFFNSLVLISILFGWEAFKFVKNFKQSKCLEQNNATFFPAGNILVSIVLKPSFISSKSTQ